MTTRKGSKRGNGEGGIYRTAEGRWRGVVDLGWQDGKRVRKMVSARTRAEVVVKLRDLQKTLDDGIRPDGTMTVGKWLDHWLATVIDGRVDSDNTRTNYAHIVTLHLKPGLGTVRLDKLTPKMVDAFLLKKAKGGLGRSYVGRMRTLLADALTHAERHDLVSRNVAKLSVMPKTEDPVERESLQPDEARALLRVAEGERLEALVVTGGTVGLRPGELLGLLWTDLDLDSEPATLTVSGSMKRRPKANGKGYVQERGAVKRSKDGLRTVALPPRAAAALKAHKGRQAAERLKAGALWQDCGLVFPNELGRPLDGANVRRIFNRIARRAGLDGGFPYLLRHTTVSLLLDSGATIEEVADLLGDDPRTLYRYYRHKVRPVADAALRMEGLLADEGGHGR